MTYATSHNARTRTHQAHAIEFIGVDGEGVTNPDGSHDYVLLTAGKQSLHRDGERLNFDDIAGFLWAEWLAHPQSVFVGYYLGYDFAQWLRDLSGDRARLLLTEGGIAQRRRRFDHLPPFPVFEGDWEFDALYPRRFKLRPLQTHEQRREPRLRDKWLTICDAGPFFQCSFLRAIDPGKWRAPIVTTAEFDTIRRGKAGRGANKFGPAMIRYNKLECDVLARLMAEQNVGFVAEDIRLRRHQWIGPGQVAQKWLDKIGAPKGHAVRTATAPDFRDAARSAYFGGWFEITHHGPAPGTSWHYDINSAYPAVMAGLPCLLHGHYEHGENEAPPCTSSHFCLAYARIKGSNPHLGAMLHRRPDRSVLRPRSSEGWYWLHELEAAQRAGLIDRYRLLRWEAYEPCTCPPPLAAIAELYRGRLALGKETPAGKARKLIYNSAYGKFAQSVGEPKYGNAIYASLITAGCRVRILEAIAAHPKGTRDLLMVATDGVVFKTPHPALDIDPARLGAWTAGTYSNLSLFMPGVYWDDVSRETLDEGHLKTRGISSADIGKRLKIIDRAWTRFEDDGWPRLVIPVGFQLVSPRQALAHGKWETCGSVVTSGSRIVSADPKPKRVGRGPGPSKPYASTPEGASLPYDGTFGEEARAFEDGEFGDHPDGPIGGVLLRELWR